MLPHASPDMPTLPGVELLATPGDPRTWSPTPRLQPPPDPDPQHAIVGETIVLGSTPPSIRTFPSVRSRPHVHTSTRPHITPIQSSPAAWTKYRRPRD